MRRSPSLSVRKVECCVGADGAQGTVICPPVRHHQICASFRLHLPFLNAHGLHTCLSPHLEFTWVSPEAKPPVKQSFICHTEPALAWPGTGRRPDPGQGCHRRRKRV